MRKSDSEIKDFNKIIEVMENSDVCRLAINDEEYPYILPLNFGMKVHDHQITLFFHGAKEGKKHELIAKNNKVSFEMDCSHNLVAQAGRCTMEYESVIGNGVIEVVGENDQYEAMSFIMAHYHKEGMEFNKEILKFVTIYQLTVKNITGKTHVLKK